MSNALSFVPSVFYRKIKRHRNIAYNQQSGHLLCRPGEGVNNGHNIIEQLVFTWGELEHTGKNRQQELIYRKRAAQTILWSAHQLLLVVCNQIHGREHNSEWKMRLNTRF